ncbi:hypothetical protein [Sphingobium yanoikuyae]|uniref:hypothetical protein n=1 Tax=Sphingobium yanoikuyae TaxID=13690 RepID=UPI0028A0BF6F|nr:hypothetical protein [Sphingobium yanoikuyae]
MKMVAMPVRAKAALLYQRGQIGAGVGMLARWSIASFDTKKVQADANRPRSR